MEQLERKDLSKSANKLSIQKIIFQVKSNKLLLFLINSLDFLLSLICIILYILMTYNPHIFIKYSTFFYIDFYCRIIFLLNFFFNLINMIFEKNYDYLFLIVDILSIFPFLIMRLVCGMRLNLINNLDMIFDSFIIFRISRIKNFVILFKGENSRELFDNVTTILTLSIISTVELNIIENTQTVGKYWLFLERDCFDKTCKSSNDHLHTTFFFIMTILTTIGYSSNINSVLGKLLIIFVTVFQFAVLIFLISNIITIYYLKSPYSRMSYNPINNVEFIIVVGNISISSITILLQDYFHPDHGEDEKHLLILLPYPPDSEMKQLLKQYQNKLFYFEGDCLKLNDLERVMFHKSKMIILFSDKQAANDSEEDEKTEIRALTIKKYYKSFKRKINFHNKNNNKKKNEGEFNELIIQLLKSESEQHLKSNILITNKDLMVCTNKFKLGLLAKSCLCPGIIPLLTNLITTNNFEEDNDKYQNIFKENSWMHDYIEGQDYEIYKISLNSKRGYYFEDIVNMVYNLNKGTILFGLHIESNKTKDSIVYLSPLNFKLPKDDQSISIYGYILAKDQNEANIVMNNLKENKAEVKKLIFKNKNNVDDSFNNNFNNKTNDIDEFMEENEKDDLLIDNDFQLKYFPYKINLANSYHVSNEQIIKEDAIYDTLQNKIVLKRGHLIICGISQNLVDFIKPLRTKNIPKEDCLSIVILNQKLPDDKIWNSISYFDEIFLVKGNPMEEKDLLRAGILSASKVVILSSHLNENPGFIMRKKEDKKENQNSFNEKSLTQEEKDLIDFITIFKYNLITNMKNDIFCLIELINPKNISYLNNKNRQNSDEYIFIKAGLDTTLTASFATGEVYYSNFMDNLMSQLYYNPNLLGVFNKFIMGESQDKIDDNSLKKYFNIASGNLYLIDMPPMEDFRKVIISNEENYKNEARIEIDFKEVFNYLLTQKKMITLGVYKEKSSKNDIINMDDSKKIKSFKKRNSINNYTNFEEKFYYVVTSPSPDFKLESKDKLFVISIIYPGKNLNNTWNLNNKNNNQFNMDKNEIYKHTDNTNNIESKENLDKKGKKKLEKINDTIEEMESLLSITKESLYELGRKAKIDISESINSTIESIYKTFKLPEK